MGRPSLKPTPIPHSRNFKDKFLYERRRMGHKGELLQKTPRQIADEYGVTKKVARYWMKKARDPNFHSYPWGGFRWSKYSPDEHTVITFLILLLYFVMNETTLKEYTIMLTGFGFNVSRMYVSRVIKACGLTFKVPETVQRAKFTEENMRYYGDYIFWTSHIPWDKLFFLDEASYNTKDLHRRRVLGPIGKRVCSINPMPLRATYNTTILTRYPMNENEEPFYMSLRVSSNTAWDFLFFVMDAVESGFLPPYSFLVIDNAAVHLAKETTPLLQVVLDAAHIRIICMPKYSPELSPAELVHGHSKGFIREHQGLFEQLADAIITGHGLITNEMMRNFYKHTLDYFNREYPE
eukprot:TRINITY_DN69_c0_g1_i2.p1 TRINITY_DN69_c0_g1~~TRINITY_DN69_c0_g1_i2.p1  ORF type:complete len:350 (+),score=51.68 TRINITY_DN69_c0_g1_i2:865-1914(+)